jgi:signal transduction histidine kinase
MDLISVMAGRRFLISAWPWRGLVYLLSASVPGGLGLAVLAAILIVGGVLSTVLIGIPILASLVLAALPLASFERWRLQIIDPEPVDDPHRAPDQPTMTSWLTTRWKEAATWREFAYSLLFVVLLWPFDLAVGVLAIAIPTALITAPLPILVAGGHRELWPGVAIHTPLQAVLSVPSGLLLLAGAAYLVTGLAAAQGRLARTMLAPRERELRDRLLEVTRSRARLLNAFETERRRIERDLHDGAQQRLVALAMSLGLARLDMPPGPAADQVDYAHEQAKLALNELRRLIHGIYPQVLTDRGLPAAAEEAADRSPVLVEVDLALDTRLPQAVEATCYFLICEALANIAKHSEAEHAWIRGGLASLNWRSRMTGSVAPTPPAAPAWRASPTGSRSWTESCLCRVRPEGRPC